MKFLEFSRSLRRTRQEHLFKLKLQKFISKCGYDYALTPDLTNDKLFKLAALSVRQQIVLANHLLVFLLTQDQAFMISGHVQRLFRQISNTRFIQAVMAITIQDSHKINIINLSYDFKFDLNYIYASRIALLKIIYESFAEGLILKYLLHRYRAYASYPAAIDQFWQQLPLDTILSSLDLTTAYSFSNTHRNLLSAAIKFGDHQLA